MNCTIPVMITALLRKALTKQGYTLLAHILALNCVGWLSQCWDAEEAVINIYFEVISSLIMC